MMMLTGHRFMSIHVAKANGGLSGTLDFGNFVAGNIIAVGSLARFGTGGEGGGVDIGISEVRTFAADQQFSGPVLPATVARTNMSGVTFSWAIDSGNATVVATLFFSDNPVSSNP
jgi:hypothetical protein